jgi:hypothetical protein
MGSVPDGSDIERGGGRAGQAARAQTSGDGPIYRWTSNQWVRIAGTGTRISVAPDGSAWVINSAGEIYHSRGESFERMPGTAHDIGVGSEGSVWIIGTDGALYRWRGNRWERFDASGMAIAVDRVGEPWFVNADGDIFHRVTGRFQKIEGRARDIGADNDVWIIDENGDVRQLSRNGRWSRPQGSAIALSVSARGPWIVNDRNEIFRWENNGFRQISGAASDIGVNSRGDAWVIGIPEKPSTLPPQQEDRRARPRRR